MNQSPPARILAAQARAVAAQHRVLDRLLRSQARRLREARDTWRGRRRGSPFP